MANAIVFHLKQNGAERPAADLILRYEHDPRCTVDAGDVWMRVSNTGSTTYHKAEAIRNLEGIRGEEIHVFMSEVLLFEGRPA